MNYTFEATYSCIQDDEHTLTLSVCDDKFEPKKFIILQRTHEHGDQDKELGMDGIYIQIEDQSRSAYKGIETIKLCKEILTIELFPEAKLALAIEGNIEIYFGSEINNLEALKTQLERICSAEKVQFIKNKIKLKKNNES